MNLESSKPILESIFDNICYSRKWKNCVSIPFQQTSNIDPKPFDDMPILPLTTFNGNLIDFVSVVQMLFSLNEAQSIFISLFHFDEIEHNIFGIKISFDPSKKIDINHIKLILSEIIKYNITISGFQSQNDEGIIKVENGDELLTFAFDFNTFTINGYSSISQASKDSSSIYFFAKCNILNEFHNLANRFLVSMAFHPDKSLNINLNSNSLLLNIPKTQNRFVDIAEYLFPGSIKHIYSHTEKSEELNAISSATIIHIAYLNKNPDNNLFQLAESVPKIQSIDSIFMLFTFLNGIPQEPNCQFSLDLLSSVIWSDLSISFIPLHIGDETQSNRFKSFINDFSNDLENAKKIPYCTCSSIVGKPGTAIIAFLNTTKESAKVISRIALVKSFEKMQSLLTKAKTYVRLNRIWESVDTISSCLSSILEDKSLYNDVWNGCCSVLNRSNGARKNIRENLKNENIKSDDNVDEDDFL